jgi:glycosyltransferase involved in cell wall biosynthesis
LSATFTRDSALAELGKALAEPGVTSLERLLPRLERDHPRHAFTFFARAEILRRQGQVQAALGPSATALALALGPDAATADATLPLANILRALIATPRPRLAPLMPFFDQFGMLLERSGMIHGATAQLDALVGPLLDPAAQDRLEDLHAQLALSVLGFGVDSAEPWAEAVFERLVLPWMDASARAGRFDTALLLELLAYNLHTKRRESQDWFKSTAGRWLGPLADHARRGRTWPAHDRWLPEPVRRVAFAVFTASMLAHVMVLVETLEAVRRVGPRNYEFTVFVLGGRNAQMHSRLQACGVAVRYLDEGTAVGLHARIARLQRALAERNFLACVWVSFIPGMAVAFAQRIAPLQIWWAMKYHACELPEIDGRLALENVVLRKTLEGREWRTIGNSSAEWVAPGREAQARALRARYPADSVVAACVGREEKLDSPEFLGAVSTLLQRHPQIVFIWTGRTQRASIQSHFERAGVASRTEWAGWVDTKLYAQAVDVFLDSFPFPCGFSLKEAMAAGKPAVMFRSPESLETGVPGALSPVARGETQVAPEVHERLQRIFTEREAFDLYLCADTPAQYVELAGRLVTDAGYRARVGAANRQYIEEFASSPEAEASKLLDHLDAFCAAVPAGSA